MSEKEYRITKEECERHIFGICEGCGGKLTAIETVDNAGNPTFWQGCEHCSCFRSGVEPIYFQVARELVEAGKMLPYSHMQKEDYEDLPERLKYYFDSQTAGLARDMRIIHKMIETAIQRGQIK